MTPELLLELYQIAEQFIEEDDDKMALAERYVDLYDTYGTVDELVEIIGQNTHIDHAVRELTEVDNDEGEYDE